MTEFDRITSLYVDRSCYVWGGQGENICTQKHSGKLDPEGWITEKESKSSNPSNNAFRVITTYRKRIAEGVNPVYGFDCSGYCIEMLKKMGVLPSNYDNTAKGLYNKCDSHPRREDLRKGDLVFYSKTGKASDISHVGFYLGDDIVRECRGREYGVVDTEFDDNPASWVSEWNLFGRFAGVAPYIVDTPEYPTEPILITKGAEGEAFAKLQDTLNNLGYKDDEGKVLVVDGKCGKRTIQAWDRAVELNTEPTELHTVTVGLDGQIVYSVEV